MSQIKFTGPLLYRAGSFAKISQIAIAASIRHATGRKLAPDWDANLETGILFLRHQFTKAMTQSSIAQGRELFDSVQPETDDVYMVETDASASGEGLWYTPAKKTTDAVLLYFHGGGYTFEGGVSARYAAMLCHHTGARLFAAKYRLTPENPHPAQAEDAMAAWDHLAKSVDPSRIVVIGDSAGGHMALMLLQALKAQNKPQPALCIGLCPWTDIGDRGASLHDNDKFDLVQGWMALQFGEWLDPDQTYGRKALSPMYHDFAGLAPLYLQAGGREVLRDMIIDFAKDQKAKETDVMLDLWPDMPHNFQAYDSLRASSTQALKRISDAIRAKTAAGGALERLEGITLV